MSSIRSIFLAAMVVICCAAVLPHCSNEDGGNGGTNPNPTNYTCYDACLHMWWCGFIDLEAAEGNCRAACEAGSYGAGWLNCVRDTVGCPATFECGGGSSGVQFPVCENVCRLGWECGFIGAAEISACKGECDQVINEIPAYAQDCLRMASSCVAMRQCMCACDSDSTCNPTCDCDPECSQECLCDVTFDCDLDCSCDVDCL